MVQTQQGYVAPQAPILKADGSQHNTKGINMSTAAAHAQNFTGVVAEHGQRWWNQSDSLQGPSTLRLLCFISGCALSVISIIQFLPLQSITGYALHAVQCIFGIITMILEASNIPFLEGFRPVLEEWAKFLTLAGGRGVFYVVIALLCFSQKMWLDTVIGYIMLGIGVLAIAVHFGILAKIRGSAAHSVLGREQQNDGTSQP